ncbi:hypothetical protein WJX74_001728 [Apatococcus lobatus]|uniref:Uncharacterized protein n=1 Tax=Apatococcus lobatus TaxID=904363 RepID=A0AAW1QTQ5_9CHLO
MTTADPDHVSLAASWLTKVWAALNTTNGAAGLEHVAHSGLHFPGEMGPTISIFRLWVEMTARQQCHQAILLKDLVEVYRQQRAGDDPRMLIAPLKKTLQGLPSLANAEVLCQLVGDAMAEMVLQGMLPSISVVGTMQAAIPSRPDADARRCSWACFAAFFSRLGSLELSISGMELLSAVERLLPKVLPEDLASTGPEEPALAKHLYGAGLGVLAQALSIPEPPLPRPRDPSGYYTGLLDDGTDPAYWPILEYDPTALDPESTEPHFVLDPDDWPLPQVSLHETPTSPPTLNISRSSTPPKEPSTPDGLGDHRAARSTDAFPASAEDLGPGVVVDGLEGHELLGGVQPDEPVHQQVDGKDGVVTQEMAQETAAKPEPNGWAQADQVDATLVADAGQAGGDEKAQEAEDEEESVRSGKKAKSRKKKKKKPEEKPATRKGNDEEDLSLIREAQEARTADIVKIDEKLRRVVDAAEQRFIARHNRKPLTFKLPMISSYARYFTPPGPAAEKASKSKALLPDGGSGSQQPSLDTATSPHAAQQQVPPSKGGSGDQGACPTDAAGPRVEAAEMGQQTQSLTADLLHSDSIGDPETPLQQDVSEPHPARKLAVCHHRASQGHEAADMGVDPVQASMPELGSEPLVAEPATSTHQQRSDDSSSLGPSAEGSQLPRASRKDDIDTDIYDDAPSNRSSPPIPSPPAAIAAPSEPGQKLPETKAIGTNKQEPKSADMGQGVMHTDPAQPAADHYFCPALQCGIPPIQIPCTACQQSWMAQLKDLTPSQHMEKLEQLVMDWFMVDIYMWVVQIDPEEPLPKTVQQLPLEELLTEIDIRLNDRDRFLAVWFAHPNWQPGSVQTFVSHGILPTHPEKLDEDIPPGYEEVGCRPLHAFGYGDLEGRASELLADMGQSGSAKEGMREDDEDVLEKGTLHANLKRNQQRQQQQDVADAPVAPGRQRAALTQRERMQARLAEKRKLEEEHNLNSQRRLREMHGQQAGASSNRAARSQSPTTSRDRGPVHDPGKARELRRFMRSMPGLTLINVGGGYEGVGDGDEHEDPLEAILKDMQADHEAGADPLWGPTPMRWRGGDRQRSSELLKDAESLREEHLGEVTIPGLEQMRDLPLALQRPNPARAAMEAAELLDIAHMYFDPHKNRKLPTWLYTPHSHTLARSLHSIPTLDQFSRMNPERRLNVMIKMTDLMSENPKPNLVMEGQRLKGFCNRSPQLVPAQKLIYSEIMKRLRDAKPYWDRAMKSLETFKAFQANDSSLAQPQMLEVPGSNPLKLQPRQKTAKPEKGKRR